MDSISYFVQFTSKTASRDKLCRLVQYTAKLIGHITNKQNDSLIKRLKLLESTMSTSRKTFRLGKTIDMIHCALMALNEPDPILRTLSVSSRASRGVFFFCDMIVWAFKAGVLEGDLKKWAMRSYKYWSCAVFICLLRDLYELIKFMEAYKKSKLKVKNNEKELLKDMIKYNPHVMLDITRNICDLGVALKFWEKTNINDGVVGAFGMISSILGILEIIYPHYKLKLS
ncbi:peroxisomal membrane protein 11B isoform X2 [Hydra vulgaris]|uniref:Peroxisomal membrane protein 11B isoform X2 n=1 Tax=Hydra vulgaris TaxID=6087 RepID=A0ABM4CZ32_HYDVU